MSSLEWGSVADWVSGLGSFAAVVVALYLSRESMRIRLKGYAGLRVIVGPDHPRKDVMAFSVTNVGSRTTVITNIGMSVGIVKKRIAIITLGQDMYSSPMPYQIADGEEAHWNIPLGENNSWLNELTNDFIFSRFDVLTLKFIISTSNGGHINIKPEKPFQRALLNVLKASG
ncbi:hypothetical protein FG064_19240 [Vibrio cholerae]|uniref:hypothetical protein n=1 Tax=Vibrio cholerae TaxID=666 RepID=UPI0011EF9BAC|nr:hypothetical protein [Vibrio cholerae]EGR0469088.1 hypothetical protein [Vibrio cholerae]TYW39630.1 hypothetical protein FY556_18035 [Vibrio cholerae]